MSVASSTGVGRAGYRELVTIPEGVRQVRAQPDNESSPVNLMANFIKLQPMNQKYEIYQYRVDFSPDVESISLRRKLFHRATASAFVTAVTFDGGSDARSSTKLPQEENNFTIQDLQDDKITYTIRVCRVGTVLWGSYEMLRIYNMNMKSFLRELQFFQVNTSGAYVHPNLVSLIGSSQTLATMRGFRTSANIHDGDSILMNLESVHKLMQKNNVLEYMIEIKNQNQPGRNLQEELRKVLVGKLVVTSYNRIVYKIEDVNFSMNPESTFHDHRTNSDISYVQYYQSRYSLNVADKKQPLLLVVQNNKRTPIAGQVKDEHDIYVIPELCNIAGLTDAQRKDTRLKVDLIKSSQIPPAERVQHLNEFLRLLHSNAKVKEILQKWGYSYATEPVKLRGRLMKPEVIGVGRMAKEPAARWPKVGQDGGFEREVMRESLAVVPSIPKMAIIISRFDFQNQDAVLGKIRQGFSKIGLKVDNVEVKKIEQDQPHNLVQCLRTVAPDTTVTLVIMPNQHRDKYNAIKKLATVERGLITQVVTSRLMMDDRKSGGASVKIGVQVAAKVGGEPWHIDLPLKGVMICGYDTYHDTMNRGRSYGAFVSSTNDKFSRWFSKADSHDTIEELSNHMSENLSLGIKTYHKKNNKLPERIFIYRDGVGDGQLEHVFKVELKQVRKVIASIDSNIRLTFIIVNKRIGARFYLSNAGSFINPMPGTVVDDVVTRKERYDFYLISQSTRFGTVAPTYYNIIYDQSGIGPSRLQAMSYKLCLLYYNWTGTVRVPAPCQYAHKLALLCGENLHAVPNSTLDDKLHFL